jgi:hypothetical protein
MIRKVASGGLWLWSAIVLTAAFALYFLLWREAPLMTPDTPSYMRVARDLHHLTLTRLHQRTPGYPLVMALTGSDETLSRPLFAVMLASQLAAAFLIAYVLARLELPRRYIFPVLAISVLPWYAAPAAYAGTESLSAVAVTAVFVSSALWITSGRVLPLAIFAVAAAYAALVRPTFQLLVPAIAFALSLAYWSGWIPTRPLRRLALELACVGVISVASLVAYAAINYVRFGQFDTSSMTPIALSSKVATVLEYLPDEHAELRAVLVKHRDNLITAPYRNHTGQDYIYRAMPELRQMYDGDELKALRAVRAASLHLILAKPFTYLHESAKLFASFWMPNDYDVRGLDHGPGRLASALLQLVLNGAFLLQAIVLLGLMVTDMLLCRRTGWRGAWLADDGDKRLATVYLIGLAIIFYTMVISCFLGTGDNRYRAPTDPIIVGSLAVGLVLWQRMTATLRRSIAMSRSDRPLVVAASTTSN